eukprot:gene10069-12344_t
MIGSIRRNLSNSYSYITRLYTTNTGSGSSNTINNNTETTHFGFKTVEKDKKESLVKEVFDNVSAKYDLMNDAMSLGIHRLWKDELIHTLNPTPGTHLLDVAGGTGDISFRFLDKIRSSPNYFPKVGEGENQHASLPSSATVFDINQSMLDEGRKRAVSLGYNTTTDPSMDWVQGNSEHLPFQSDTFNCYTISFGIRNCTNIDVVLKEAYRVLKKGGRFLCLEFSHVPNPVMRYAYDAYSFNVIPVLGQLILGDRDSYQYLVESIRKFPEQDKFAQMMRDAGFKQVTYKNLSFGICAIHSGWKL